MASVTQYFVSNKEWLIPALGIVGAVLGWYLKWKRDQRSQSAPLTASITQSPSIVVNNNIAGGSNSQQYAPPTAAAVQSHKEKTVILFIDDDTEFKIVNMLRKAGWKKVSIIADVDRMDHDKVRAADIIFIDVHGVGKKLAFEREGLGLMKAIKQKYPKKSAVIYSSVPLHDIFGEELDYADKRLRKTSEFIEFENAIEALIK